MGSQMTLVPMTARLLFPLFLLIIIHTTTASFVLTVPSGEEDCFVVRTPKNSPATVSGNFDVLTDDLDPSPITVAVFGTELDELYTSPIGVREDHFHLNIGRSQRIMVCVSNGHGYYTEHHEGIHQDKLQHRKHNRDGQARVVGLQIRVSTKPDKLSEQSMYLLDLALDFQDELYNYQNHLDYLKNREAQHRTLAEQTFTRVVNWNLLEVFVLLCVSCGQVLYFRRFFEKKRYM